MEKLKEFLKNLFKSEFDKDFEIAEKEAREIMTSTLDIATKKEIVFLNKKLLLFMPNKCYHEKLGIFEATCEEILVLCKHL